MGVEFKSGVDEGHHIRLNAPSRPRPSPAPPPPPRPSRRYCCRRRSPLLGVPMTRVAGSQPGPFRQGQPASPEPARWERPDHPSRPGAEQCVAVYRREVSFVCRRVVAVPRYVTHSSSMVNRYVRHGIQAVRCCCCFGMEVSRTLSNNPNIHINPLSNNPYMKVYTQTHSFTCCKYSTGNPDSDICTPPAASA